MANPIYVSKEMVLKNINEIKPYWRNPRHNDKTVEALVKVIPDVGFNVPLVIDSEGVIVKGHARYRAALKLGLTELPCVISPNDEEKNKLDRLTDNKISELTEWDIPELRYELEQIDYALDEVGFEIPKDDFLMDTYAQEEFNEVDDKALADARAKVLNSVHSTMTPKSTTSDFDAPTPADNIDEGQEEPIQSKMLKITCPHCGEEIIVKGVIAV